MPVLTGTPSLVIASRVQVYHSCSVDLTWQRAVHSCQRCPRAALVRSSVTMPPITQSHIERAHSRFCPAGVHMGSCVPASEIFSPAFKHTVSRSQSSLASDQTSPNAIVGSGLELMPSVWGPPNLPVPTASSHHPLHASHINRASYPPATFVSATTASSTPTTVSTVDHFPPQQRAKLLIPNDSSVSDDVSQTAVSRMPPTSQTPLLENDDSANVFTEPPKVERIEISPVIIVREIPSKKSEKQNEIISDLDDPKQDSNKLILVTAKTDIGDSNTSERKLLGTSGTEGFIDVRPSDDSGVEKLPLVDSSVPSSKVKTNLASSESNQTTDDSSIVGRAMTKDITSESDVDRTRMSKTLSKTPKLQATGVSSAAAADQPPESRKADSVQTQNRPHSSNTSATCRDTCETARHSSQTKSVPSANSSSGAVGDINLVLTKPNGIRIEQARLSSPEVSTPPISKQLVPSPLLTSRKPVPSFHFPIGTTRMTSEEMAFELDRAKRELNLVIERLPATDTKKSADPLIPYLSFGQVAKALKCPLYWKYAIYAASGGSSVDRQPISVASILKMWNQVLTSSPDETARFVHMLTKGRSTCLVQTDFNPLIQDILESHPGLAFLQAAKDFHSRYVATVVSRIFFCVNSAWSGRISLGELRRSNFLSVLSSLEDEEDINLVTQYFSYEHFYVIYCKFWELDEDHDLIISRADLARHNNYAISERMIDRIFSGTVTRGTAFKQGVMTYPDFVWFLLAEEDKRHPRSIEYWFRCMDLDGDGLLSMYELEYFYSEQVARMEEMGIEPISFEDCLCQCLDMVKPELGDKIRLADMKQCRLCHIFFDTFFNLPKYLQHEQRDPFANLRDIEEGLNELSDWDRYAAEAYEMLVAVESGNQEDVADEEEGDEEDLDDVDVASTNPMLSSKADNRALKDGMGTTNNKLDSKATELSTPGTGETAELTSSSEPGRKGRYKRGVLVNGTASS